MILFSQSDFPAAHAQGEESVALLRQLGDKRELSASLDCLAYYARCEGDEMRAGWLWKEGLTLVRELNDKLRLTSILAQLGYSAILQSDWIQAEVLLQESLTLARALGFKRGVAVGLSYFAVLSQRRGDLAQAAVLAQEGLSLNRESGQVVDINYALDQLGKIVRDQGDLAQAKGLFQEGLSLAQQIGYKSMIGWQLVNLASVAVAERQPQRAAYLLGAAENFRAQMERDPSYLADYERVVASLRTQLDEEAFSGAWDQGRTMTVEQVLAAQGQPLMPTAPPAAPRSQAPGHLS